MSNLRAVVYVSSAVRMFSESELAELLVEARRLNLETETTGVLLYSGGSFMQCFEAGDDTLETTYLRIRSSRKHHSLIELVNEPIATRDFTGWQMGCRRVQHSEVLALSSANWQVDIDRSDPATSAPSAGRSLLKQFWERAQD